MSTVYIAMHINRRPRAIIQLFVMMPDREDQKYEWMGMDHAWKGMEPCVHSKMKISGTSVKIFSLEM